MGDHDSIPSWQPCRTILGSLHNMLKVDAQTIVLEVFLLIAASSSRSISLWVDLTPLILLWDLYLMTKYENEKIVL